MHSNTDQNCSQSLYPFIAIVNRKRDSEIRMNPMNQLPTDEHKVRAEKWKLWQNWDPFYEHLSRYNRCQIYEQWVSNEIHFSFIFSSEYLLLDFYVLYFQNTYNGNKTEIICLSVWVVWVLELNQFIR